MVYRASAWHPARVLHLAGLRASVRVGVAFRGVIVVARLRAPIRVSLYVKSPVRQINSSDRVGQRGGFQPVRCEPTAPIPLPNCLAHVAFADLERQQTFRTDWSLDLFVGHKLRRTAKVATLRNACRIKH